MLLTFDHELPLGKLKSSYKEAMFDPTYRLLEIAEGLNVPVVLFTDVLSAIKFKQWDYEAFYIPYIKQIQNAIIHNHDVQLHLHPHWLTSNFQNNAILPSNDFRLADFEKNENNTIEGIIGSGVNFLKEVGKSVKTNYQCVAFRAGGFNLEGPSQRIFNSLYNNGIRFDSSVIKGFYYKSNLSEINYLKTPKKPNWLIGLDGNIKKDAKHGIMEIPIASIPKSIFEVPTRFKLKKLSNQAPPNHGSQIHNQNPEKILSKIKMIFSSRMLSFDNYTFSVNYLMKILNYNLNKYKKFDTVIFSIVAHPKSMGDYSFLLMESFIKTVRKRYENIEFTTFSKLANEMQIHENDFKENIV